MDLPDANETFEVTPEELVTLLEAGQIRLIDCREEDEWAICRIEGATLIPLQTIPEKINTMSGEGEPPIVVYCHHGMRSLDATRFLRAKGIDRVFSLRGGIERWSLAIDPKVARY